MLTMETDGVPILGFATRRAPPLAVQLGSMKIWAGVNDELKALGEKLRKRTEKDPELI